MRTSRSAPIVLLLGALCLVAYWPAFDNRFISDDYVLLERVESWRADYLYLFSIPPEHFRTSTYAAFLSLKAVFGYHSGAYYAGSVLLHFLNTLLLWKLVGRLTDNATVAVLSAVFFASFQDPQEAVMWLAAMNELLLGLFLLATLILWREGRFFWSAACYCGAIFSKESAPLVLVLIPMIELCTSRRFRLGRRHLLLLVPTVFATALFVWGASENSLIQSGAYSLRAHSLLVWMKTFGRLAFPWLLLAVAISFVRQRWSFLSWWPLLIWIGAALGPYVFLTYRGHLPSRQLYVASMGVAFLLALLVERWSSPLLAKTFVAAFLLGNIFYLWIVKDPQYEARAAPSAALIEELKNRHPVCLAVRDFPENPWIGKLTTRLVPGWRPDLLIFEGMPAECRAIR